MIEPFTAIVNNRRVVMYGIYNVITKKPVLPPDETDGWDLLFSMPCDMDLDGNVSEDTNYLSFILIAYGRNLFNMRKYVNDLFRSYDFVSCDHVYCFTKAVV